ncbi:hypothetical protein CGCF415_v007821 [Colletotrichum fructicola]|nr:hypothetical protein CGCFRS4_v006017 [Colletotrichum fructicola]KAF4906675.1 hypothetical protein CGCF415_v007821 [Colletotrichum fructicola]KAF4933642.1 hypothetical protein CGCF245_v009453 [Colletotrichum fructicola]
MGRLVRYMIALGISWSRSGLFTCGGTKTLFDTKPCPTTRVNPASNIQSFCLDYVVPRLASALEFTSYLNATRQTYQGAGRKRVG